MTNCHLPKQIEQAHPPLGVGAQFSQHSSLWAYPNTNSPCANWGNPKWVDMSCDVASQPQDTFWSVPLLLRSVRALDFENRVKHCHFLSRLPIFWQSKTPSLFLRLGVQYAWLEYNTLGLSTMRWAWVQYAGLESPMKVCQGYCSPHRAKLGTENTIQSLCWADPTS